MKRRKHPDRLAEVDILLQRIYKWRRRGDIEIVRLLEEKLVVIQRILNKKPNG